MNIRYVTKVSDLTTNINLIDEFILMNDVDLGTFYGFKGGQILNLNNHKLTYSSVIGTGSYSMVPLIIMNGVFYNSNAHSVFHYGCILYNCHICVNENYTAGWGWNADYKEVTILNCIIETGKTQIRIGSALDTYCYNSIIVTSKQLYGRLYAYNCELIWGSNYSYYGVNIGATIYGSYYTYGAFTNETTQSADIGGGDGSFKMYLNTNDKKDYWKNGFVKGQKFIVDYNENGFFTQTINTIESKLGLLNLISNYTNDLYLIVNYMSISDLKNLLVNSIKEATKDKEYFILSKTDYSHDDLTVFNRLGLFINDINNNEYVAVDKDNLINYDLNDYNYFKKIINVETTQVEVQYFSKIELLTEVNDNIFISKVNISN